MGKHIQLFVPTFDIEGCLNEIRECLEKGWTGSGFKTIKFEEMWRKYTGLPYAHFLTSNTVGLHMALKMYKEDLGWSDGDEVITTPLTFVSTNHVILYERLNPIFADVDDTLCLDPASIKERITKKTRAVMYVGIGGNAGKLDEVIKICKENNLKLVVDAAHMAGTYYKGKHVGQNIDCCVFSFQSVKNLPTADSGMICFNSAAMDTKARMYSWLGINKDTFSRQGEQGNYKWLYDIDNVGLKAHGNSIMASIGLVQLKHLEKDNNRRREISKRYEQRFSGNSNVRLVRCADDCVSSRHLFQIRVSEKLRDGLVSYLNSNNIFPGVHYRINTEYKMYRYGLGTCPRAELASREVISLPIHIRLLDEDVDHVGQTVLDFFKDK